MKILIEYGNLVKFCVVVISPMLQIFPQQMWLFDFFFV